MSACPLAHPRRAATWRDVQRCLMSLPQLGQHGFGTDRPSPTGDFLDQVNTAAAWLDQSPTAARVAMRSGDSYHVKHRCEEAQGAYISNGALIVAAALAGYTVQRTSRTGQNCVFPSTRR